MAKGGRKYRLLLYRQILDRWWPATFGIAFVLFLTVAIMWGAEWYASQYFDDPGKNFIPHLSSGAGWGMLGVGIFALVITFYFLLTRNMAYVQLFDGYLKLATPFLRINIAYKRIHRTNTAQVSMLFPPNKLKGSRREIIEPISGETALVLHLTAYPLSRNALNLFLSPLFFYDKTPHIVLIVDDWMRFSVELDSRRMGAKVPRQPAKPKLTSGLLDDLNRK